MFGGRCTGVQWVRRFWEDFPHGEHCNQCHCYRVGECEVDSGVEGVQEAECLMDFVASEEITTYWRQNGTQGLGSNNRISSTGR